jgi:hypothetical protein
MKSRKIVIYITPAGKATPGGIQIKRPGVKDRWAYHKEKTAIGRKKLEAKIIRDIIRKHDYCP